MNKISKFISSLFLISILTSCASTQVQQERVGYLTLNSTPWGEIFVNGAYVGMIPLVKADIVVGSHQMEVRREGYETFKKTIVIHDHQSLCISLVGDNAGWKQSRETVC